VCAPGWTDIHCQTMINYCHNVTCHNRAICRPLLSDYKCECLTSSYSGRHCENVARSIVAREIVAKSFAYVVIIALSMVIIFIAILDILKYGFGIDPVRNERELLRRQRIQYENQNHTNYPSGKKIIRIRRRNKVSRTSPILTSHVLSVETIE
jgi:hypothetical protein